MEIKQEPFENPDLGEKARLELAVTEFSQRMIERLCDKVDEGYAGWDNPDYVVQISEALVEDVGRYLNVSPAKLVNVPGKILVDIANRSMMLFYNIVMSKKKK